MVDLHQSMIDPLNPREGNEGKEWQEDEFLLKAVES